MAAPSRKRRWQERRPLFAQEIKILGGRPSAKKKLKTKSPPSKVSVDSRGPQNKCGKEAEENISRSPGMI